MSDARPDDLSFYRVELSANGQPDCQCAVCQLWTITYNDPEPIEIGTSWSGQEGKDTAEDVCDLMNMAYNAGIDATQVTPALDCRSAVECRRTLSDGSFVPPPGWEYVPDLRPDADRYRFLRKSEADMGPNAEVAFGKLWQDISLKGCEGERMDSTIDLGRAAFYEAQDKDEEDSDE